MRILLDTHCWLWLQADPGKFSSATLSLLEDPAHELLLSAASCWELSIKYSLGKLPLPEPAETYVLKRLERHGVIGLSIELRHALHAGTLPMLHRDPFDRLLVAQAQLEGLALPTADSKVRAYPDVDFISV